MSREPLADKALRSDVTISGLGPSLEMTLPLSCQCLPSSLEKISIVN